MYRVMYIHHLVHLHNLIDAQPHKHLYWSLIASVAAINSLFGKGLNFTVDADSSGLSLFAYALKAKLTYLVLYMCKIDMSCI